MRAFVERAKTDAFTYCIGLVRFFIVRSPWTPERVTIACELTPLTATSNIWIIWLSLAKSFRVICLLHTNYVVAQKKKLPVPSPSIIKCLLKYADINRFGKMCLCCFWLLLSLHEDGLSTCLVRRLMIQMNRKWENHWGCFRPNDLYLKLFFFANGE